MAKAFAPSRATCRLAEVNDTRIHGTTKRRPVELHEQEKPHLIPLPAVRFDTAQVVYRVVDSEGFISYADNRYSVPWRLVGQTLPVRIMEDQLHIYNKSIEQVAEHNLLRGRNQKQICEAPLLELLFPAVSTKPLLLLVPSHTAGPPSDLTVSLMQIV